MFVYVCLLVQGGRGEDGNKDDREKEQQWTDVTFSFTAEPIIAPVCNNFFQNLSQEWKFGDGSKVVKDSGVYEGFLEKRLDYCRLQMIGNSARCERGTDYDK